MDRAGNVRGRKPDENGELQVRLELGRQVLPCDAHADKMIAILRLEIDVGSFA